jgi:hypothetical protein
MTTTTPTGCNFDFVTLLDLVIREGGEIDTRPGGGLSLGTRRTLEDLTASGVVTDSINCGLVVETEHGFRLAPKVGMGATLCGWSDRHPYEVVEVSPSGKTITLRAMKAERDPSWKPEWVAGGFAGTVVNQNEQEWILSADPEGETIKARLTKKGWSANGQRVYLGRANKFYDYNF